MHTSDAAKVKAYMRYWGKASPKDQGVARYHLLAYHSLDVAACGMELLQLPRFGLKRMSSALGWTQDEMVRIFVALLALHDCGKFSRSFQSLVEDLGGALVPKRPTEFKQRHDTMGWIFLSDLLEKDRLPLLNDYEGYDFWLQWMRIITGHHGLPPVESSGNGPRHRVAQYFHAEDCAAANDFVKDVFALLLGEQGFPAVAKDKQHVLQQISWQLAGFAVLADWIGSNAAWFEYHPEPQPLADYWEEVARPRAIDAVRKALLAESPVRLWGGARELLGFEHLTPLQHYASTVALHDGPQLFLLEDVTGAGKTEAALLLAHRIMAMGQANGLYFGLPTMATSNQLYRRVSKIYSRLYQPQAQPSLVLSHGARDLVEGFRDSVLPVEDTAPAERRLVANGEPASSSAQCAAWLADSRKKALLADVGVGTVDQALLGILPVRHQSLRLLGLAQKVLIVDEVHAYDDYTGELLQHLVRAQAMAGGSTILLSATVPAKLRRRLVCAFADAAENHDAMQIPDDHNYPLATHAGIGGPSRSATFDTREELKRSVAVKTCHTFEDALEMVLHHVRAGRAVCWIRNTVSDARIAFEAVMKRVEQDATFAPERMQLFHAQFAMGDRLGIEASVLENFGKDSAAEQRRGRLLIATQVVEQSLDLDFDFLLSDLAPIDLLIQRAGRLHRHLRDADGNRLAAGSRDGRQPPVLCLLTPEFREDPPADWYAALFPKATYVYPDTGRLWLTLRALLEAGCIVSPGTWDQAGGVRPLMEAVYGDGRDIPEVLDVASRTQQAKQSAQRSQAHFNALKLESGYSSGSSDGSAWHEKVETPTRLGDERRTVYLARESEGVLHPFYAATRSAWEMSAVSMDVSALDALAPEWQSRFASGIAALRSKVWLLNDEAEFILPLVAESDGWIAHGLAKGKPVEIRYSSVSGFKMG